MSQQQPQQPRPMPQQYPMMNPYGDTQNIRKGLDKFKQLPPEHQRTILGEMMMPNVQKYCSPQFKKEASKITGMLIDFTVFEVEDILDLLESPQDLREKIAEAEQLIQTSSLME